MSGDSPLDQARRRFGPGDFVGEVRAYCNDPACAVEALDIPVRERFARTPPTLRCPGCATVLTIKRAVTMAEAHDEMREHTP